MDMHTSHHPVVQQLWEKFERAVQRKQSQAMNEAPYHSQLVPLHTQSGIFQQWAYEVKIPHERSTEMLGMVTRGLYQYYVGRRLPQDTQFEVMRITGDLRPFETTVQILLQQGAPCVSIGDGQVFKCIYACSAAHPEVSLRLFLGMARSSVSSLYGDSTSARLFFPFCQPDVGRA